MYIFIRPCVETGASYLFFFLKHLRGERDEEDDTLDPGRLI
jgi:hypothetical protein